MVVKTYTGKDLDVTFDAAACVHCGYCTKGLGAVFDLARRPWILPDGADAAAVAAQVRACPSGALQYIPKPGAGSGIPAESPDERPSAVAKRDGPLHVRGDLRVTLPDGTTLEGARFAFCRCGRSARMPFCDATHRKVGFRDPPAGDAAPPAPPVVPRPEPPT